MADFSFLHAADLHLDTPFEGLSQTAPAIAGALRDASLTAFDRLIERAIEERVAFALFAGDIYDGPERGLRAQLRFLRGLERLSAAGIPAFIVHGNHDPVEAGWSAVRAWPPGVHVFGARAVERRVVEREGQPIAIVHGRSFGKRAERKNLAKGFRRAEGPVFQVGLLHANVGGQPGHDDYAPCRLDDLRAARLDYWALGHVHTRQVLLEGETWAVYPGNLQGRSLKAAERGLKGASLVRVRADRVVEVEHLPLAPIRFEAIAVDVGACRDLAEVERALLHGVEGLDVAGVEGLVVAAELRGDSTLHEALSAGASELRQALDDLGLGGAPWIHWARLSVATAPPVDRAALAERQDLLGALLRRVSALRADPEAMKEALGRIDRPLRGLKGWREAVPLSDEALLAEVEREAIKKLLE